MSEINITQSLLLPDLRYVSETWRGRTRYITCKKVSKFEVCPRCATKSSSVYDRRKVRPKDEPIRNKLIILIIEKRRFRCQNKECKKVFTEPIGGVSKGFRTTQRLRSYVRECAVKYMNLKQIKSELRLSNSTIYKAFYQQIELELRKVKNPWPKTIGIDEHSFNRNARGNKREFVTVFIDYDNKRMKEVVLGKSLADLRNSSIDVIKDRENVKNVIVDLSPTFRTFAFDYFPNARLIADHFHVVKLMHPYLNQLRKETVEMYGLNNRRANPINKLIYKYRNKVKYYKKKVIDEFLKLNDDLREVYEYQQRLYRLYRIKGYKRAKRALIALLDDMARSKQTRILSYRNTLKKWKNEILNYFCTGGLNNGRTEGYNCKAKLIQRCAYGFRSFTNYRLKLLYHCR